MENILDIEKKIGINTSHEAISEQSKHQAEIDGRSNIPEISVEGISSTEYGIRNQYQVLVDTLGIEGEKILQKQNINITHLKSELEDIEKNPNIISDQIRNLKTKYSENVASENAKHQKNTTTIWQNPSYTEKKKELQDAQVTYNNKANFLKRSVPILPRYWYWILLIIVGIAELAFNYSAFSIILKTNVGLTYIAALLVVVLFPVFAHSAGISFREISEKKKDIWIGILSVILSFALSYILALIRVKAKFRLGKYSPDELNVEFKFYLILMCAIFFMGLILAFLAHDPSPEFVSLYKIKMKKEEEFSKESNATKEEIGIEQKRHDSILNKLKVEYDNENERLNQFVTNLKKQFINAKADNKASIGSIKNIEKTINNKYKQTINEYRATNLEYRLNQQVEPIAWKNQPEDLKMNFDTVTV